MKRRPFRRGLFMLGAVLLVFLPLPANATYPGGNGLIAYGTDGGIRVIQPDGSNDHSLLASTRLVTDVAFSMDGLSALIAEETLHGDRIVMLDLYTGIRSIVLAPRDAPTQTIYSVSMSPNGDSIVFCSGLPVTYTSSAWTAPFSARSRMATATPTGGSTIESWRKKASFPAKGIGSSP